MSCSTPLIPDSEIDAFLELSESPEDDSRRCRQMIGQLRWERDRHKTRIAELEAKLADAATRCGELDTLRRHERKRAGEYARRADERKKQLAEAERARDELRDYLRREGYRRCDIPACNCGSWHGGHAFARLREIIDALGGCNGVTALAEVEHLLAQRDRLAAALRKLVASIERWESEVEKIIGRVPRTYIELDQARAALAAHEKGERGDNSK